MLVIGGFALLHVCLPGNHSNLQNTALHTSCSADAFINLACVSSVHWVNKVSITMTLCLRLYIN